VLFTSPRFFVFLIVLLCALRICPGTTLKKRLLAVASCVFYAAWDWRYLGLLVAVSVIDYIAAARIHATTRVERRRAWLLVSVV